MHKVILPIILSAVLGLSLLAIQTNQVSAIPNENANEKAKITVLPDGTRIIEKGLDKAIAKQKYTTISEFTAFEVDSSAYPTVAKLLLKNGPTYLCTGVLVDSQWILTAAHCVSNINTGKLTFKSGTASFGDVSYSIATAKVPPEWDGNYLYGNDIALLKLKGSVSGITPSAIDGSIDVSTDNLGTELDKAGYGQTGLGSTGATVSAGTLHAGENIYDSIHDDFWTAVFGIDVLPSGVLLYDFDNGEDAHDAFLLNFGIKNENDDAYDDEVNSAPGDSGGPTLVDTTNDGNPDTVVGITSYGMRVTINGENADIDGSLNSSFGEYSGDTTVAIHKSWIDSIIGGEEEVDEPKCNKGMQKRKLC